ncbi:MAG: efflux RND transporter periplasmic adaptor subunit [Methylobacter sp.]|uniref:efflux RND transporter periplasmic adaptor subunit n=1 Tax=Methylobacter sp. TaxID=2051955 RepID=UPI00272F74C7|nr:efflux RND transporter periplasmic adaptor subunit [Methylobacter sp.]MDP1666209.1 efflux RND transporter periplasmic adaptor subunit [Methylobacter sp.]
MAHIKLIALFSLIAISAGIYGFNFWRATEQVHNYRTETIAKGNIVKTVSANGTLNPVVLVNVGTQISGVINKLNVDFNDRVRKDQVLAEIDPSLIDAQLEQSRANLANAQASLKLAQANATRSKELYVQDYVARSDLDQAVQALAAAKAQVASAIGQLKRDKANKGYTIIRSPVFGIVVSRNVDIGQTVAASFQTPTLFTIAQDLQRMQIDTSVAEADVGGIRVNQTVNFTVDAYPDRAFQGKVFRIRLDSKVLQNVVTYNVVISVDNPEEILLPGMTAFVNIIIDERNDTLKLPLAAFKFRPAGEAGKPGKNVYRLENNKAVAVPVQTGIADGKYAELTGGELKEGDSVILEDRSERKADDDKGQGQGGFRVRAF